ncbi:MAG: pyruvate ferredoxin oxidoreductase [Thermoproteota archaeon]|nr:MAG: pyruvate ferredoxin oxidoreductase [Candidatus Korarchaeota archaeon]
MKKGWREVPIGGICWVSSTEYKTGTWKTYAPRIDYEKCTNCGFCWFYCPDGAIRWNGEEKPKVDYDYCKGCGICAHECPAKAITMELEVK